MKKAHSDDAFFTALKSHRVRGWMRLMRRLPADPRCAVCHTPYKGLGGRLLKPLGFGPSRKNPRLCVTCFERVPEGGYESDVGVLFVDIRGYTALTETSSATEIRELLSRFYQSAVDVLCAHAIIDKMVGDQVMALYLPGLFDDEVGAHMLADARALIDATDGWVNIGIGLDFGTASVGNVGAGDVKDFTAIGDVVNTAARLQGVAAAGQIVLSPRVAGTQVEGAVAQTFALKGKAEPVEALVVTPVRS